MAKEKILVVASHPDDEVIGCGGSMVKWQELGHEVRILILADGVSARHLIDSFPKEELIKRREAAMKSADIMGIGHIEFLDFPDNRMDTIDLLDIITEIEDRINSFVPDTIVTHWSSDLNIDHRITQQAVVTASRPQPNNSVKKILSFEVPSATNWQLNSESFDPNFHVDITETLSTKIKALNAYKYEMRKWPHSRSIESIENLAKYRGSSIGVEAAESFVLLRQIN